MLPPATDTNGIILDPTEMVVLPNSPTTDVELKLYHWL